MTIYSRTGDAGQTDLFPFGRISKTNPRMEALGTLDELNASLGLLRAQIQEDEKNLSRQDAQIPPQSNASTQSASLTQSALPTRSASSTQSVPLAPAQPFPLSNAPQTTDAPKISDDFPDGLALDAALESHQKIIFRIASEISSPNPETSSFSHFQRVTQADVKNLEKTIDVLEALLPPLRQMLCFQGPLAAAHAQLARAVCRRAERCVWRLEESIQELIAKSGSELIAISEAKSGAKSTAESAPKSQEPLKAPSSQAPLSPHIFQWLNRFSDFLFLLGRKLTAGTPKQTK